MITTRTKRQLIVFVILTLAGCSFVGARYARLDRLFYDSAYKVSAHFAESGGIFTGAEVSYRGVRVGQVTDMRLTHAGVDVILSVDNGWDKIPSQTLAVVANKSAVGEQYVDLEPQTDGKPYLRSGSQIQTADTRTPISPTTLLQNVDNLVQSVPQDSLKTAVNELGNAFVGSGPSLANIISGQNDFLKAANDNFATTAALIADSRIVLQTQVDKATAIRDFSRDLSLFTDTLAGHDAQLRALVTSGAATAVELRTFLEQNQVNLGRLISNLLTTNQVAAANIPGIQVILTAYPYMTAGSFTVLGKQADGTYHARFGLVLQQSPPVCTNGYGSTTQRPPSDLSPAPLNTSAKCTDPPTASDPRGIQNAPRAATDYRAPVAIYDESSGTLTWADQQGTSSAPGSLGSPDSSTSGKDSLAWLLFQPVTP